MIFFGDLLGSPDHRTAIHTMEVKGQKSLFFELWLVWFFVPLALQNLEKSNLDIFVYIEVLKQNTSQKTC